jgi:hypothetical protein
MEKAKGKSQRVPPERGPLLSLSSNKWSRLHE